MCRLLPILAAAAMLAGCAAKPVMVPGAATLPAASPLQFPVAGGNLPASKDLLPGAPRDYRGGIHEGIDIYHRANGDGIPCGEPVLNASDGWVIRADVGWRSMSQGEYLSITGKLKKVHDEELLDRLRGRQVWVRLEDGSVLRYCHLGTVAAGLASGVKLNAGTTVGTVGNSGTTDGSRSTGKNCHLHFEVWLPSGNFPGQGLSPGETRVIWQQMFGFTEPEKK